MGLNELGQEERIRQGKDRETWLLELLNNFQLKDLGISNWVPSTDEEDMHDKIDAWAMPGRKSVQLKTRDSGGDLGVSIIRPWINFNRFLNHYESKEISWDRDAKFTPDFYACYSPGLLMVVRGDAVRVIYTRMLKELYKSNGFVDGAFDREGLGGAQLRLITDKGEGYTQWQQKVICYIEPSLIRRFGGIIIDI